MPGLKQRDHPPLMILSQIFMLRLWYSSIAFTVRRCAPASRSRWRSMNAASSRWKACGARLPMRCGRRSPDITRCGAAIARRACSSLPSTSSSAASPWTMPSSGANWLETLPLYRLSGNRRGDPRCGEGFFCDVRPVELSQNAWHRSVELHRGSGAKAISNIWIGDTTLVSCCHHCERWRERAYRGFTPQLENVPAALARHC
jgi:hypothetical protein